MNSATIICPTHQLTHALICRCHQKTGQHAMFVLDETACVFLAWPALVPASPKLDQRAAGAAMPIISEKQQFRRSNAQQRHHMFFWSSTELAGKMFLRRMCSFLHPLA